MKARALGSFFFLAFIAFSSYAGAKVKTQTVVWGESPRWLSINEATVFRVNVSDQVGDGCWTNISAVKTAVELEIKRSDFKLADDKAISPTEIYIVSIGYKISNGCLATYRLEVSELNVKKFVSDGNKIVYFGESILWVRNGVLSGSKDSMNGALKSQYVDSIQEFLLSIDRNKKKVLEEIRKSDSEAKKFWSSYKY